MSSLKVALPAPPKVETGISGLDEVTGGGVAVPSALGLPA
jgi:hypothetical protein